MRLGSHLLAFIICSLTALGFLLVFEPMRHWFIIPVTVCGILIGADAIDWFRHLDPFDPVGILGLLGIHFFFLAPLLHVRNDQWMYEITPPPDWRPWLGTMACFNALGLLAYLLARESLPRGERQSASVAPHGESWHLNKSWFYLVLGLGLLVSAAAQLWIYASFGGILNYIETSLDYSQRHSFLGMGWIFMIAECFPILAMMTFAVFARGRKSATSATMLVLALLTFIVVQMLFGGLRGSRSNIVWGLFWAVGIIHFWLRPISRSTLVIGGLFLVLFMYLYGLYKGAGLDALETFDDTEAQSELAQSTHRTFETTLLGDLGRSDVQAFLLYRMLRPDSDFDYGWGRTYLGTATLLIPRFLWPNRPPDKRLEGTEALFGRGSHQPFDEETSRVFGVAGEAMLNFGPAGVPFAFAGFGFLVGGIRRFIRSLGPDDPRRLAVPMLIILAFSALVNDSDILLFFLFKEGLPPVLAIWVCSLPRRAMFRKEA